MYDYSHINNLCIHKQCTKIGDRRRHVDPDYMAALPPWRSPSRIWLATSFTAPGPWGMKTAEDFDEAPISFIVSKYWVTRTISMTSLEEVPGTFSEKASTLSLRPSTMAWRWRAMPRPDKYLDSASPSALLICRIFSASAFSVAASRRRAAVGTEIGYAILLNRSESSLWYRELTSINLVHRPLDLSIRLDVNDQSLHYLESIRRHSLHRQVT